MKSSEASFISAAASVLLVALWCAAGCQSAGYRKSETARRSLETAAAEVQVQADQIDVTLQSLNDLIEHPASDLKPQFQRFSAELDRLVAQTERVERTRQRMARKNAEYFDAWDRQASAIQYGTIRHQSTTRRSEVTNRVHAVNSFYVESQEVAWLAINYFKDIRTALSLDLTSAGLESVKAIAASGEENAKTLQATLGRLSDALAISSRRMPPEAMGSPPPASAQSSGRVTNE